MQPNEDLLAGVLPTETPWALVTGASKGIGQGIAVGLAKRDWNVAIHYHHDLAGAQYTEAQIKQVSRAETRLLSADVCSGAEVEAMFAKLADELGGIDLLVNNAGVEVEASFLELKEADWDRAVQTNLKGTFLCSQQAAHLMATGHGGMIVNIGSGAGTHALPGHAADCASKAGVEQLTKVCAVELGPRGVRVNCVIPGPTSTERTRTEDPDFEATWSRLNPMRNVADVVDISDAVCFLASPQARFINGQTLTVDGGIWSQVPWPFATSK